MHEELLNGIFEHLYPSENISEVCNGDQKIPNIWIYFGFSQKNPIDDLNDVGIFGLLQILAFITYYGHIVKYFIKFS